jgi:hypothetical protein
MFRSGYQTASQKDWLVIATIKPAKHLYATAGKAASGSDLELTVFSQFKI